MLGSGDAPYDSPRSLLKIIHDQLPPDVDHNDLWDPTKFYNIGDIVTYQGHKYQCTIAHQSQASWTPGTAVPLWKEVDSPLQESWNPTKSYNVGDVVTYQDDTYQCTIAHQSQASWTPGVTVPLWDKNSDPSPNSWDPTKFYNVGDVVTYQGRTYRCTIAHQSQESWTPSAAVSLWKETSDGHPSYDSWDPTKFYNAGSMVSYQGGTYQCTIAHQSQGSRTPGTSVPLWEKIPNPSPKSWDSTKSYTVGYIVTYQGHFYKCTIAHQSEESRNPGAEVQLWKKLSEVDSWDPAKFYDVGDLISHDGQNYQCTIAHQPEWKEVS